MQNTNYKSNRASKWLRNCLTVAFLAVFLLVGLPTAKAQSGNLPMLFYSARADGRNLNFGSSFTVIAPDEAQAQTGKTYGEWSAEWWRYVLQIPLDNNPIFDATGANCNYGQTGAVFFLLSTSGGSATRNECRVPAGKILFLPLLTISSLRGLANQPEHSLRNYNRSFINSTRELQVNIDGTDVGAMVSLEPRATPLQAASPEGFFTVIAPENNVFGGIPGQSYETVADGFYLLVAPLSPGAHTIKFGGVSRNFAADVTYNLIVEP